MFTVITTFCSQCKVNAKAPQRNCCEAQTKLLRSSIYLIRSSCQDGGRRYAVLLLERGRKMGRILEPYFGIDVHHLFATLLHLVIRHFKALADEPLFRSEVAYLLEIPLEGGQTPTRIMRHLLHCELVHIVFIHKFQDVYLPRFVEVEERGCKPLVDMQQSK